MNKEQKLSALITRLKLSGNRVTPTPEESRKAIEETRRIKYDMSPLD